VNLHDNEELCGGASRLGPGVGSGMRKWLSGEKATGALTTQPLTRFALRSGSLRVLVLCVAFADLEH
jgi:hypothetical protein